MADDGAMFVVVVTSSTSLKILLPNDILVSKNGVLFGNDDDDSGVLVSELKGHAHWVNCLAMSTE